ncbi:MAG: hypothetical protein AAB300_00320 [Nitrospirota bacterium]
MKQVTVKNKKRFDVLFTIIAMVIAFIGMSPSLGFALNTPAGTVVGNQASATYAVGSNTFTAQSNLYTITVSQVAALSLTPADQLRAGAPANEVQFPHTVTNLGNSTDTFNLTTALGGTVTLSTITIIRDDNGDGIANPGEPPITSLILSMDQSQMIVVRGTIPSSASNNATGTITLTATSAFSTSTTLSSVDTAKVVTTAVISLSKSVSALTVDPFTTGSTGLLDYTINYTNIGVASTAGIAVTLPTGASTQHVVRDLIPTNTTFVSFQGTSTPSGGQLVYHVTTDPTHTYVTTQPAAGTFDAVAYLFATPLTGGQSGIFSFRVRVNASAQVGTISNQAVMHFHDSATTTLQLSNTTGTKVNLIPKARILDTDATLDDIQIVASGSAGLTVDSRIQVENISNGQDRYNITVANTNYPAGTTFALFSGAGTNPGVTPLLDTNADGVPDTGLMNAASTLLVIMRATLPANATNSGAPFDATTTASSVANSTVSDTVINRLSAITAPGVDVTQEGATGVSGVGPGPGGAASFTIFGDPGQTVDIDLNVKNEGPSPDSFDIQFASSTAFNAGVLPANITQIVFFLGNGSGTATGSPIMSTGQIGAAGNQEIIARVTISSSAPAATTTALFFRGTSVASLATDIIRGQITVNTIRKISLLQKQSAQASAGSATTYSHVLKNLGNIEESQINLTAINSQPGFLTTIYLDIDSDGLINASDAVVTSVALNAGSSTSLIIRVAAPSSAANGTVDSMTLTATPTSSAAPQSNIDETTVVTGQIELTLTTDPPITTTQAPGTIITYKITYQNVGAAEVGSLVITDAIPVNTTYHVPAGSVAGFGSMKFNGGPVLTDADDTDKGTLMGTSKSSVRFNVGTVLSGATGNVSFQVTID